MKNLTPLLAGTALGLVALPAFAGVVITQKQSIVSGANNRDSDQTIMLQGNKQKMVTDKHTIITDLDKGMVYILDPAAKTYFQIEFPPKGPMAAMMAASAPSSMNFKKSASSRDVAGFKCTDYDGGGHVMAGDYTIKECFSNNAPGAAEYSAFQKNMASKLKASGAAPAMTTDMPEGVPLASDSTMKMGNVNVPGMSPEQTAKINQMMASRPPVVTKTVVTKIAGQTLADDTFAIPAGFTKKDLPQGPGGMGGGMHMGGAPAGGSGMHMGGAPASGGAPAPVAPAPAPAPAAH